MLRALPLTVPQCLITGERGDRLGTDIEFNDLTWGDSNWLSERELEATAVFYAH